MLRNILLFTRGNINHNSLNHWSELSKKQLTKQDINVHILSINNSPEKIIADLSAILSSCRIDVALAFNAIGQQNYATSEGSNLWDAMDIPFFNYIVDHPLEHVGDISSKCKNYHLICIDRNHVEFVKRYFPDIKSVHFLPLGGFGDMNTPFDSIDAFRSRSIDVALTAGLWEPELIMDQIRQYPDPFDTLAMTWIDWMKTHLDEAPEIALRNALDEVYPDAAFTDEEYFKIATFCNGCVPYIRTWIRKQIVEKLMESGINISLYGNGWDELNSAHKESNIKLMGDIPIEETADLYRNVKLAINILPMFKLGTHDRISTAQIGGAAVLTDRNSFLEALYPDNSIFFYDLNNIDRLAKRITDILADEENLYQTALKGHETACRSLSWDSSGEKLIEILEQISATV